MDGRAFTRQLSAWLDPWRLLSLSLEYARSPAELEQHGTAAREASFFALASDVGLDQLRRARFLADSVHPTEKGQNTDIMCH